MPAQTASTILIETALPQHHTMTQCDQSTLRYFDKACCLSGASSAKTQTVSNRQAQTSNQTAAVDMQEKTKHGNVRSMSEIVFIISFEIRSLF